MPNNTEPAYGKIRHCTSPETLRTLFPALRSFTYLSICDKMILADPVRAGTERFLDKLALASANRTDHEEMVEASRTGFARMVNAAPAEIAVMRNVSDGINALAWSFPFQDGDNVVLCLDGEHPNNAYPWLRLRKRGVGLRIVAAPDGRINAEAMIAAMDAQTRLVSVASVTFAPGERTDLTRLGEHCRKKGIFLLVDGVQSAGILHHDFANEPIDGFATSTSKGLLGLYGYGFLYVREAWLDRLTPAYLSRTGVEADDDHASSMGQLDYRLKPDARRFELGSYNLAASYAAEASLSLLLSVGTPNIEKHVLSLAERLRDGLADLGLAVFRPRPGAASHLVTVGAVDAGGHGYSDDPRITALYARLSQNGIVCTVRRGQLRFGLHAYNAIEDIDHVVDVCAATPT